MLFTTKISAWLYLASYRHLEANGGTAAAQNANFGIFGKYGKLEGLFFFGELINRL